MRVNTTKLIADPGILEEAEEITVKTSKEIGLKVLIHRMLLGLTYLQGNIEATSEKSNCQNIYEICPQLGMITEVIMIIKLGKSRQEASSYSLYYYYL